MTFVFHKAKFILQRQPAAWQKLGFCTAISHQIQSIHRLGGNGFFSSIGCKSIWQLDVVAQTVLHFDLPITVDSLELSHKSAIHIDASQGVFDDHEAWLAEYKRLHAALAKHLKAGGLALHEKQTFYLRIYFQTEGHIGHLSYQHLEGTMTEKQAQLFEQLMTSLQNNSNLKKGLTFHLNNVVAY